MADQTRDLLQKSAPWRRGIPWPLLLAEGVILVAVGIYLVADPDGASGVIRQLIAAVLLINSALIAIGGIRNTERPALAFSMLRAGVGATVGTIVLLESVSDYLEESSARLILGWGLIAIALLALAGIVVAREERGLPIGGLVLAALNLVLGVLFLTGSESTTRITTIGVVAIIFGLLLAAYGVYLSRRATSSDVAPPTDDPPPTPVVP